MVYPSLFTSYIYIFALVLTLVNTYKRRMTPHSTVGLGIMRVLVPQWEAQDTSEARAPFILSPSSYDMVQVQYSTVQHIPVPQQPGYPQW